VPPRVQRFAELTADELRSRLSEALELYVAAMHYPKGTAEQRAPMWLAHMLRFGWRCVAALDSDEGLVGIGETDTNPWVARAMIEAPGTHIMGLGLTEMLIGKDPTDVEGLWERMYAGSAMTGRRGLGICAIGALDMALWDLRGKAEGKPCWQLLGGALNNAITPYASLLPEGDDLETYTRILVERAVKAKELGFRAVKLEICTKGPYSHNSLQIEDDREIAKIVRACRKAIGSDRRIGTSFLFPGCG